MSELGVALKAAEEAGALALEYAASGVAREYKGERDVVTAADRAVEALIRRHIASAFPDDLIVGEEGATVDEATVRGRRRWYVDPIDGTTNFSKGRHWWCISIAFCDADDRIACGVVSAPDLDERYVAERGGGATYNGRPARVAQVSDLGQAVCSTGFPSAAGVVEASVRNLRAFEAVLGEALAVRVPGAVALDVCSVASGQTDAVWTLGVERWDLAAASLIAAEAGATVTDLDGGPVTGPARVIVAAAPGVHGRLLELVSKEVGGATAEP